MKLRKGQLLYRASPIKYLQSRVDPDTGKYGQYYSFDKEGAEMMVLEYQKSMFILTCRLIKDVDFTYGKYETDENHFDDQLSPIIKDKHGKIMMDVDNITEFFICGDQKEFAKVVKCEKYNI